MSEGVSYPPTDLTGLQSQIAGKADTAAVPQPATSAPPGVADSGSQGSVTRYAMENHTHASKARKASAAVASNVGTYTWTYPTPFGAGVVPICNAIAQTASGVTDLVNIQIDGAPTNTQCTFRITRYSQSFLSILGLNVLTFNSASLAISLHMLALEP
jgi:hypothetical protein